MADQGSNGWWYGSIACYYGRNVPTPKCRDCNFFSEESGKVGLFGDFQYKCYGDTGSVASQYGQGKSVSNPSECSAYEKKDVGSSRRSGGKKKPIWLCLIRAFICCPICCVWSSMMGGKQFDIDRGCKKGCEWCRR